MFFTKAYTLYVSDAHLLYCSYVRQRYVLKLVFSFVVVVGKVIFIMYIYTYISFMVAIRKKKQKKNCIYERREAEKGEAKFNLQDCCWDCCWKFDEKLLAHKVNEWRVAEVVICPYRRNEVWISSNLGKFMSPFSFSLLFQAFSCFFWG